MYTVYLYPEKPFKTSGEIHGIHCFCAYLLCNYVQIKWQVVQKQRDALDKLCDNLYKDRGPIFSRCIEFKPWRRIRD